MNISQRAYQSVRTFAYVSMDGSSCLLAFLPRAILAHNQGLPLCSTVP